MSDALKFFKTKQTVGIVSAISVCLSEDGQLTIESLLFSRLFRYTLHTHSLDILAVQHGLALGVHSQHMTPGFL